MKICPKCGYQRNNKDNITSESECPKCGVIYSKAKQKITPNQATSNKAENISHASETSALSPEERRKIYEEEKFRIEARAKIKKEKKIPKIKKRKNKRKSKQKRPVKDVFQF